MAVGRTLTKRQPAPRPTVNTHRLSVDKSKISSPVTLLSTTNILSYTSPNLNLRNSISTGSLSSSSSENSTHTRSPTATSWESDSCDPSPIMASHNITHSPPQPLPVAPRRHTHRFANIHTSSESDLRRSNTLTSSSRRAGGVMNMALPPKQLHSSINNQRMRSGSVQNTGHPFEVELAQVKEMTEELGLCVRDAEEEFMDAHGLRRWRAEDYVREIFGGGVFEDEIGVVAGGVGGWI